MPNIKDEILKEFDDRVTNGSFDSSYDEDEPYDHYDTDLIAKYLESVLDRYLSEALKLMPEKEDVSEADDDPETYEDIARYGMKFEKGFNKYHDQFLSNLKNGGFIKE